MSVKKDKEVAALYDQRDALQEEVIHLKDCVRRIADELEYEKQENAKLGVWLRAALEKQTALTGELTKLRSSSFVTAVPAAQYERLLRAGDSICSALILFERFSEKERQGRLEKWAAAKQGKDKYE